MPESGTSTGFAAVRQFVRKASAAAQERCDLCGEPVAVEHRHLLDLPTRSLLCVCRACSILFNSSAASSGTRILVPDRCLRLVNFAMSDIQWQELNLPVNMAFFYHDGASNAIRILYPSPAGATDALVNLDSWRDIRERNPILETLAPDVEALLINRVRTARDYYLAPIDQCYKLVGLVRIHWRGLGGGSEVWKEIEHFFTDLQARSKAWEAPNA
jgi:hypothetical protein